jgi:hypothetical protein
MPPNNQKSFLMKIFSILKLILILAIGFIVGTFIYTLTKKYFIFSAQSVLAVWLISFIFALITKSSYGSKIFLFDLLLATILVSFYPFGQGLFIVLLILLGQKLFKML